MKPPTRPKVPESSVAVLERRPVQTGESQVRERSAPRAAGSGRILVATADPREARRIRSILAAGDWAVSVATAGEEALRELSGGTEMILLGLPMSGPYGRLILESIRDADRSRRPALLAIVKESAPEERRHALEAGADQAVPRPFDSADLLSRTRALMEVRLLRAAVDEARSRAAAAEEELAAVRADRSALAGKLAHDLKNPLTGIMGHAQMLQMKLGSTSPVADGYAAKILGAARQIQQSLTDARDLGLLGEGRFRMSLQGIDLHAALAMVVKERREEDAGGGVDLELVPSRPDDSRGPAIVEADPGLLLRMLGNLVTRASLQSAPEGKVRIVLGCPGEGKAEVHISSFGDEDAGAPRDASDAGLSSGRVALMGQGLRMAFCQAVAEAFGGRLWVRTNAAGGHTIGLLLRAGEPGGIEERDAR